MLSLSSPFLLVAPLVLLLKQVVHGLVPSLPKAASPDTPWSELEAQLSSSELLLDTAYATWREECWEPFVNTANSSDLEAYIGYRVTNYELALQPNGLCLDHPACSYSNCLAPPSFVSPFSFDDYLSPFFLVQDTLTEDDLEKINLPTKVLQPAVAADIVKAIEFCTEHDVGITVKTSGHSYYGASNANGTLLIQMNTNYPHYTQQEGGSITECAEYTEDEDTTSAVNMACALATARDKKAIMRVGGGEFFDHAYRAVSFDWNENPNNTNEYHLVGGAAGTVSAAGGWLHSGGLSGTNGMRMFGLGIDQVLHIEMVLPSGAHVRFGPSQWESYDGGLYPMTTEVTGFCNANPLDSNEDNWVWEACSGDDASINFEDLWFAVRGGGGGTFGILTSVYYQLHERPGNFQLAVASGLGLPGDAPWESWTDEQSYVIFRLYIDYLMKFLYLPQELNITAEVSNGCSGATTLELNPISGGTIFCFNESGTAIVEEWKRYITNPDHVQSLVDVGFDNETITAMEQTMFTVAVELPSYTHAGASQGIEGGDIEPVGRIRDNPKPSIVPLFPGFPDYTDAQAVHIPVANFSMDNGYPQLLDLMVEYALATTANTEMTTMYNNGGNILYTSDKMNALSPTRRNAGIFWAVPIEEYRNRFFDIIFGTVDDAVTGPGGYPGMSCHNHAFSYDMGPLKTDWTKSCPTNWPQEEREEKCISQQESTWGTDNLARLEEIKSVVDPNSLFICAGGVGYDFPASREFLEAAAVDDNDDEEEGLEDPSAPTEQSDDELEDETTVEKTDNTVNEKGDAEDAGTSPSSEGDESIATRGDRLFLNGSLFFGFVWALFAALG